MTHVFDDNQLLQRPLIMAFVEASYQAGFIMHHSLATAVEDRIVEELAHSLRRHQLTI
jgi:hypothetical protein